MLINKFHFVKLRYKVFVINNFDKLYYLNLNNFFNFISNKNLIFQ